MTTTSVPILGDGETMVPWLARMRGECPVWTAENGVTHVFRYADVQSVLGAPERFSSELGRVMPFIDPEKISGNLVWTDPPAHRSMRQIVSQAFTPRTVAALRPQVAEIASELIAAAPSGEFDIVDVLACALPITVIAELLGVSPADRAFFRASADRSLGIRAEPGQSAAALAAVVAEATAELDAYLLAEVRRRRSNPAHDLLSDLTATSLTDTEVTTFATLLLTAGYVTTTLLIGNTLLCLRDNPVAEAALRADRTLLPGAVEEVLRCRPPFPHVYRIANDDTEIAGVPVRANAFLSLSVLSANRDERVFPDADRFDVHRDPNRHLAFGHGIHFCLGAPLARLETGIAIGLLLDEFAELTVTGDVEYHDSEFYGARRMVVAARR
jgi:cytochrome P450